MSLIFFHLLHCHQTDLNPRFLPGASISTLLTNPFEMVDLLTFNCSNSPVTGMPSLCSCKNYI